MTVIDPVCFLIWPLVSSLLCPPSYRNQVSTCIGRRLSAMSENTKVYTWFSCTNKLRSTPMLCRKMTPTKWLLPHYPLTLELGLANQHYPQFEHFWDRVFLTAPPVELEFVDSLSQCVKRQYFHPILINEYSVFIVHPNTTLFYLCDFCLGLLHFALFSLLFIGGYGQHIFNWLWQHCYLPNGQRGFL